MYLVIAMQNLITTVRHFSPTSSHFEASGSEISIAISSLQHHSQEVIVYISQSLFQNDEDQLRHTKFNQATAFNSKRFELPFFQREKTKGFLQCSFQVSNFLASLRASQFNLPTKAVALKYPRFTCKEYFKPRFRFILSGKATFNQI